MKSVLVIGIGRFGLHISKKFAELGGEVLAVDTSEECIHDVLPFVSNAQVGDCTKEDVLEALGVRNFDICVVSLSDLGASLETTYLLKELGAPFVLARASHEMHEKLLLRSGADEIVYPEKQMAERLAVKHTASKLFDYIEITSVHSVSEIHVPQEWIGKNLEELDVRKTYKINVLAYKVNNNSMGFIDSSHRFTADEHLIVFGTKEDIIKLSSKL